MSDELNVFVFSSDSITNIWAGYGAATWAVSQGTTTPAKRTKSGNMQPGSLGILYCVPWQAFTVPFVTTTVPDKDAIETDIWNGEWILPFQFKALASPRRRIDGKALRSLLPGMERKDISNFSHYLHVQSNFDFQPSKIGNDDWSTLVDRLVANA